jgi:3-oxoacyl-[acyl-carrier-protein] synthase-3
MIRAAIEGIGHALPRTIVTNDELALTLDTTDEWIRQRTGIGQRRVAQPDESTGSLAIAAAREALADAHVEPAEVELVIVATITGDYVWPATACVVQAELGIHGAGAYDISAACAGFIYSLDAAAAQIETGRVSTALVIGADCLSKQVDWSDRSTAVLFGDAAAAVVVRANPHDTRGLVKTVLDADGNGARHIWVEAGGNRHPLGSESAADRKSCLTMNGKEVFRFAVKAMGDACERVLQRAGLSAPDIDLFVPHQANSRIILSAAERLELPPERVFMNVEQYGNTSGGSIPLALYEANRSGRLQRGMKVLTVGFGAGLVWGANIIEW